MRFRGISLVYENLEFRRIRNCLKEKTKKQVTIVVGLFYSESADLKGPKFGSREFFLQMKKEGITYIKGLIKTINARKLFDYFRVSFLF